MSERRADENPELLKLRKGAWFKRDNYTEQMYTYQLTQCQLIVRADIETVS